jgi:hypothetical protein
MDFQRKTLDLFAAVNAILGQYEGPLTLRQVFYRLVAAQQLENTRAAYCGLSKHLVNARLAGIVDDSRIVDRVRNTLRVPCWNDLPDFLETVRQSYRREKWTRQPYALEVWCEKDAVAGVLQPVTDRYEVLLFPCRGYDSYSALKDAGERIRRAGRPTVVLYLGDFDPSGQDMPRDIRDRLTRDFGATFDLRVIALTREQVDEHDLPQNFAKRTDSRAAAFIARHGDIAVELDALPPNVLQALVREHLDQFFDVTAFAEEVAREQDEQERLDALIRAAW